MFVHWFIDILQKYCSNVNIYFQSSVASFIWNRKEISNTYSVVLYGYVALCLTL